MEPAGEAEEAAAEDEGEEIVVVDALSEESPAETTSVIVETFDADEPEEEPAAEEVPESEQMEVELTEDEEELAVGPINMADMKVDLDQSQLPEKAPKPVIRAKPLKRA